MSVKSKKLQELQKGFTLIELLIVIVIITALAVTVFVALNPVKRIKDAHDSRRAADVETILTAIHEYIVDHNGSLPPSLAAQAAGTQYIIGTGCGATCNTNWNGAAYSPTAPNVFSCNAATAYAPATSSNTAINLGADLASYLNAVPQDPLKGSTGSTIGAGNTGYAVSYNASNQITVVSCYPEDTVNGYIYQSR